MSSARLRRDLIEGRGGLTPLRGARAALAAACLGLSFAHAESSFQTAAPFALLIDFDSGATLFDKSADEQMSPASTTKMLTAEVVFHEMKEGRLHLEDIFTVSDNAWRNGGAHSHGSAMFLDLHSKVRVEDLIRGMIIQSGNDAAITLAEGVAGSEQAFAEMMNKRAQEIGMTKSFFVNPVGLGDPRHRVTARDMAKLAVYIIKNYPEYYRYFGEKDFTWNKIHQQNRNPLLTMGLGADGLKTGDIAESGFGLVGSAVQNGQRLVLVINGLRTASDRSEESRKLLTWGFRSFDVRELYAAGDEVGSAEVYGGQKSSVPLEAKTPIKLFVPRGAGERLSAHIVYRGPLEAPVAAGADVAKLRVFRGDTLALEAPLRTKEAVETGSLTQRALDAALELAGDWVRSLFAKR